MTDPSMTEAQQGQVAASAAEVYDELFVPALFGQWTGTVLDAARVGPAHRVLDVGCGTGVLARAAAARVAPDGEVVGLDINEAMLAVARRRGPQVTWHLAPAEHLPFDDAAFDRVVSQFALMFLHGRDAAVREMARVLAPGGRIAVATWARAEDSPGYAAMIDLLDRMFGAEAAAALGAPFALGTEDDLRAALAPAFPDADVDHREGTARFASIAAWIHTDIRGWTLDSMVDDRDLERLVAEAEVALAQFTDREGKVRFPVPALIATAAVG